MNQVQQFIEYVFNVFKIWVIIQPWQAGIRVRLGKKITKLEKGIYFKLPYFDSVYVQEKRLRIASMPVQTLTTQDGKTVTLNGAIGYSITDIQKLYNTLYHPESTIRNIVMSEIVEIVGTRLLESISPKVITDLVMEKVKDLDYGIHFEDLKIMNFAVVRTYRLIQDGSWDHDPLNMDAKV